MCVYIYRDYEGRIFIFSFLKSFTISSFVRTIRVKVVIHILLHIGCHLDHKDETSMI